MRKHRLLVGLCKDRFYSLILKPRFWRYFRQIKAHKPKKVIYTCIVNGYDCLNLNVHLNCDYDYICFTDSKSYLRRKTIGPWQIKPLPYMNSDTTRNSRYPKMHPHVLFPEYEQSIYIDANIVFKDNKIFDAAEQMSRRDDVFMAIPPHRRRDCAYDELEECLRIGKDNPEVLLRHKEFLEKEGFPHHMGLTENGVIFRKHNDKRCIKVMNDWWNMLEKYSRRDQLSLQYVLWKNGFSMPYLLDVPVKSDKTSFRILHHNR